MVISKTPTSTHSHRSLKRVAAPSRAHVKQSPASDEKSAPRRPTLRKVSAGVGDGGASFQDMVRSMFNIFQENGTRANGQNASAVQPDRGQHLFPSVEVTPTGSVNRSSLMSETESSALFNQTLAYERSQNFTDANPLRALLGGPPPESVGIAHLVRPESPSTVPEQHGNVTAKHIYQREHAGQWYVETLTEQHIPFDEFVAP